jgi:uncharacterized protein
VYVSSIYNFRVPVEGGALLYNSRTGNVLKVNGQDSDALLDLLTGPPKHISHDHLPSESAAILLNKEFLVAQEFDELREIRLAFARARHETPMVVTITTTMDCNLGCYYCYESRTGDYLKANDARDLAESIVGRARSAGRHKLHIDWYGGEPLLNIDFMEAFATIFQPLCDDNNIRHEASIISNGTNWPSNPVDFVLRHKIRQVQISLDGLRENHNKRRRFRNAVERGFRSSFDEAIALIDKLFRHVRVDVRLNLDRRNLPDVSGLVQLFRDKKWFEGPFPVVVQPARLGSYTEKSAFMRSYELAADEFDRARTEIRRLVGGEATVEEAESPDGFPSPRRSVCAALAKDSFVIGADYLEYRCGLQVGERHRSPGPIRSAGSFHGIPIAVEQAGGESTDREWWERFDPTTLSTCARCSFLPVCWGGCPKKHLEKDGHAIAEQGEFWRSNLARLVATNVNGVTPLDHRYQVSDQFRRP